ncbi:hypothetical protein LSTR_LSTR017428 [Laodelphax striatellus]|uniref:Uncharacterized protein n=1 Tax=Laodelphax striatellus TaxID=195883 RepID=A0A482XTJ9_LAOST|nr:hypothetical protein LSTR_LSTR017428 [Laodelphax striatellus]
MTSHGLRMILRLGRPNDSLELSFSDQSSIKLDVFFFYRDADGTYWNGGTQVKSGRKFKCLSLELKIACSFLLDVHKTDAH